MNTTIKTKIENAIFLPSFKQNGKRVEETTTIKELMEVVNKDLPGVSNELIEEQCRKILSPIKTIQKFERVIGKSTDYRIEEPVYDLYKKLLAKWLKETSSLKQLEERLEKCMLWTDKFILERYRELFPSWLKKATVRMLEERYENCPEEFKEEIVEQYRNLRPWVKLKSVIMLLKKKEESVLEQDVIEQRLKELLVKEKSFEMLKHYIEGYEQHEELLKEHYLLTLIENLETLSKDSEVENFIEHFKGAPPWAQKMLYTALQRV